MNRLPIQRQDSKLITEQHGATTVEVAVSVFPVMIFLVGMMQLSIFAMNSLTLQFSLQKAMRYGSLGNAGAYPTRFDAINAAVKKSARDFGIDSSDITVKICPESNPACAGQDPGGSGQFVVISAQKSSNSIFGVGEFNVQAKVLARNEPF